MTLLEKQMYKEYIHDACVNNDNPKDLLCYGKGVSQDQRFFWINAYIENIDHSCCMLLQHEDYKTAEPKRRKEFIKELYKIVAGFLLWYYKREPIVVGYTLDKMEIALEKHPVFASSGYTEHPELNAYYAVREEMLEFLMALHSEKMDRQLAEAFDVSVTCCRYLNEEWEK